MQPIKILAISALLFAALVAAGCVSDEASTGDGAENGAAGTAPPLQVFYTATIYTTVVEPLTLSGTLDTTLILRVTQIISTEIVDPLVPADLLKVGDEIVVHVKGVTCVECKEEPPDPTCTMPSGVACPTRVICPTDATFEEKYDCWNTYNMDAGAFPIEAKIRCLEGGRSGFCAFWEAADPDIIKPPI